MPSSFSRSVSTASTTGGGEGDRPRIIARRTRERRAITSVAATTTSRAPLPGIAPNCVAETLCATSLSSSSVATRAKALPARPIKLMALYRALAESDLVGPA
eukprot:3790463-Pyramimonas_sp.AAC.1